MKNTSLLMPLFKAIDKVLFGIEECSELEKNPEAIEPSSNEEITSKSEKDLQIVVDCQ